MRINLYLAGDGSYILVPDCFLPSIQCQHRHGPLQACGQITVSEASANKHWQGILAEMESSEFVRVDSRRAEGLFDKQVAHDASVAQARRERRDDRTTLRSKAMLWPFRPAQEQAPSD